MSESSSPKLNVRTLKLVESVFDNTISEVEFEELVEHLNGDPNALATYVEYVNLHSGLRQAYLSESADDGEPLDFSTEDLSLALSMDPVQGARSAASLRGFAVAAALLLAVGWLAWRTPAPTDTKKMVTTSDKSDRWSKVRPDADVQRIAVITRQHDVVWEDEANVCTLDEPLARQRLDIKSGLLQIEFYCGAAVIVEGPASFELLSADRAYAHYGKLRAYVPAQAQGFTIGTKSGDVIDLGTEFGLDISDDGESELHVIDGEVDFQRSDASAAASKRLVGGQAMKLDRVDSISQLLDSNADRFMSPAQLQALASQKNQAQFEAWLDYHERLQKDPALVADYSFTGSHGWGRTLVNAAPGAREESYGAVVGAMWQRGRWEEFEALRFDSPSDRVRVKIDGDFESLTLATWVNIRKFEDVHHVALLHPEINREVDSSDTSQRFIHWSLVRAEDGAVLHFSESQGHGLESRNHYNSIKHGVYLNDFGKWLHLAVVYDRDAMRVSHYRNGDLVGAKAIETPRTLGIGVSDLGNWPYKEWAAGTQFEYRNLDGKMDEFVVLSRAMSDDEIREMYQAGQP